jgi:photosystem II stability/assembly factor-like uncharacterized protein
MVNVIRKTPLVALLLLFGAACSSSGPNTNQPSPQVSPVATVTGVTSSSPVATAPALGGAFYSVDFVTPNIGWAVGGEGIFSTEDGGKHWMLVHAEQPRAAGGELRFLDAKTGFALLGNEGLSSTTDGGHHWAVLSPDAENRPEHIDFVTPLRGWAIASTQRGAALKTLLRTDDGGQTYTEAMSPTDSVCFGSPNVGWAANGGEVKRSLDGGLTWTTSFANPVQAEGDKVWEPTLQCTGNDVAWLLYRDGVGAGHEAYLVFRTVDGGASWQPVMQAGMGPSLGVHVGVGAYAGPFSVVDASTAFVVGTCAPCGAGGKSSIEVTHDGGVTWEQPVEISRAGAGTHSLFFVDREHGWLATETGVFATTDGGQTWVDDTPTSTPPSPGTTVTAVSLDPADATPSALRCDAQFGVTRVNQLFAALNRHDLEALTALFPAGDTGWDFEVQPDILLAATSTDATASASDIDVTSHADLGRIMAQFAGFHLVFTAPPEGAVATEMSPGTPDRRVVAIGPVLWQGTSPSLTERGKTAVFGGGKTAVDCSTGLFSKVLLGPLRYSP